MDAFDAQMAARVWQRVVGSSTLPIIRICRRCWKGSGRMPRCCAVLPGGTPECAAESWNGWRQKPTVKPPA